MGLMDWTVYGTRKGRHDGPEAATDVASGLHRYRLVDITGFLAGRPRPTDKRRRISGYEAACFVVNEIDRARSELENPGFYCEERNMATIFEYMIDGVKRRIVLEPVA